MRCKTCPAIKTRFRCSPKESHCRNPFGQPRSKSCGVTALIQLHHFNLLHAGWVRVSMDVVALAVEVALMLLAILLVTDDVHAAWIIITEAVA